MSEFESMAITSADMQQAEGNNIGQAMAVRAAKEVEAQVILAKRFPREMPQVERKIMENCARVGLAEKAEYSYSRGGTSIMGPSIRLAETIMQSYGNVVTGWQEIQRHADNSDCEAYAWDIENNVKVSRQFNVPHYRDTKTGKRLLTDDRDIREMCANMASRNLRACILQIIPGDLTEMAVQQCRKTLDSDKTSVTDQFAKWAGLFERDYQVTQKQLIQYLGTTKITVTEIHRLRKLYNTISNGESTIEDALNLFAAKITGTQIKELAALIMTVGEEKGNGYIKTLGFETLKDIPTIQFEDVKAGLQSLKSADSAPKKSEAK